MGWATVHHERRVAAVLSTLNARKQVLAAVVGKAQVECEQRDLAAPGKEKEWSEMSA
jgi:hypothetical protein